MKFKAGEETYEIDKYGVVHQLNAQPYKYDEQYCATYDTPAYVKGNEILQALRLGFACASHGRPIDSILDVGFGNGAFMKFAKQSIPLVLGHDISGVEIPRGCFFVANILQCDADVIIFNDCLEHYADINFVKHLQCETLIISLPFYPGEEYFTDWVHRKKNEHLHHFTETSLNNFMFAMGWKNVATGKHEDIIRKRNTQWNILTAAFKRL